MLLFDQHMLNMCNTITGISIQPQPDLPRMAATFTYGENIKRKSDLMLQRMFFYFIITVNTLFAENKYIHTSKLVKAQLARHIRLEEHLLRYCSSLN